MRNEDLMKCPLLQGLDAMRRAELIGILKTSNVGERVEQCVAGLPGRTHKCEEPGADFQEPSKSEDFEASVHNWDPDVPLWRRSAKE